MHIVITGANGFVGQVLTQHLLSYGLNNNCVKKLTLLDLRFEQPHTDPRVHQISGSISDPLVRENAYSCAVDIIFHLASLPGGASEKNYELGKSINLDSTLGLLEDLRNQTKPPTFIFASSVAVYGKMLASGVNEQTLPAPSLTYGAHKLASEYLIADASRKGWINGCSLRIPGVVARPGSGEGLMSAFMSQLFWKLAAREAIVMPVTQSGTAWWISAQACALNLMHAATLAPDKLNAQRCYLMPALHLSMIQVVAALSERYGPHCKNLVSWNPDPVIEKLFARYPPLYTHHAEKLGFRHDGDVSTLVSQAMAA
jgi:nucleoside-diphosphate-sugar epimerase